MSKDTGIKHLKEYFGIDISRAYCQMRNVWVAARKANWLMNLPLPKLIMPVREFLFDLMVNSRWNTWVARVSWSRYLWESVTQSRKSSEQNVKCLVPLRICTSSRTWLGETESVIFKHENEFTSIHINR